MSYWKLSGIHELDNKKDTTRDKVGEYKLNTMNYLGSCLYVRWMNNSEGISS